MSVTSADALKQLCFQLKTELTDYVFVFAANVGGKANVAVMIADNLVADKGLEAPKIIKEKISGLIKGGGGGQKSFASAGGQETDKLDQVITAVKAIL